MMTLTYAVFGQGFCEIWQGTLDVGGKKKAEDVMSQNPGPAKGWTLEGSRTPSFSTIGETGICYVIRWIIPLELQNRQL